MEIVAAALGMESKKGIREKKQCSDAQICSMCRKRCAARVITVH